MLEDHTTNEPGTPPKTPPRPDNGLDREPNAAGAFNLPGVRIVRDLGSAPDDLGEGVRLEDFHAYMPLHKYMFVPARELWPGSSVNARLQRGAALQS